MTSKEQALIAAKACDDKKAIDIVVSEVRDLLVVTDYFVIATAQNVRQVIAIIDEVEERLRIEAGIKPIGREGLEDGTWALLDYGDFVVHVFQPEQRDFYRLETLWREAPIIDLAEAGITEPVYTERVAKVMNNALGIDVSVDEDEIVSTDELISTDDDSEADAE